MAKSTDHSPSTSGAVLSRGSTKVDWRSFRMWGTVLVIFAMLAAGIYAARRFNGGSRVPLPSHSHNDPGERGGVIVPVGHEHFHVEVLFTEVGVFKLFTLAQDQTRKFCVPMQTLKAYARSNAMGDPTAITLNAVPQPGDPNGQTSAFEGQLPQELIGAPLLVVVPDINFGEHRYRIGFFAPGSDKVGVPRQNTEQREPK